MRLTIQHTASYQYATPYPDQGYLVHVSNPIQSDAMRNLYIRKSKTGHKDVLIRGDLHGPSGNHSWHQTYSFLSSHQDVGDTYRSPRARKLVVDAQIDPPTRNPKVHKNSNPNVLARVTRRPTAVWLSCVCVQHLNPNLSASYRSE